MVRDQRCVRPTSATQRFLHEHPRFVGFRFVTSLRCVQPISRLAALLALLGADPMGPENPTFHDARIASAKRATFVAGRFSPRHWRTLKPLTPLSRPPLDPMVLSLVHRFGEGCRDRFHRASREERAASPARDAFPRQVPFSGLPRSCGLATAIRFPTSFHLCDPEAPYDAPGLSWVLSKRHDHARCLSEPR